jgi:hypothetical protein
MKKIQLAKNEVPTNSSMATNMEEMKNLGKQVEQMKTNEELKEEKKIPDPQQDITPTYTKEKIEKIKSKHRLLDAKF